jgi:hypothetical protein
VGTGQFPVFQVLEMETKVYVYEIQFFFIGAPKCTLNIYDESLKVAINVDYYHLPSYMYDRNSR